MLDRWPAYPSGTVSGDTKMKVPTELVYTDDGKDCRFACEIGGKEPRYGLFKLGLSPQNGRDVSYLTLAYPEKLLNPSDLSLKPEKLCTDYLRKLFEYTISVLKTRMGPSVLDTIPIEIVLTVPAMFGERAQALTWNCARAAGISVPISMVSEPEAAITVQSLV